MLWDASAKTKSPASSATANSARVQASRRLRAPRGAVAFIAAIVSLIPWQRQPGRSIVAPMALEIKLLGPPRVARDGDEQLAVVGRVVLLREARSEIDYPDQLALAHEWDRQLHACGLELD